MKKFLFILALVFASFTVSAKQCAEYYRYNLSMNVAQSARDDLRELISSGYKIISFSLDYSQRCMIVVYDNLK